MQCRRPPVLTTVIAAAAVSLLAAGCGGDSSTTAATTTTQNVPLAYSHCMHSHGVPDFPDPTSSGQLTHEMVANAGIDLHQPAVLRAGDACVSVTHGVITKAIVARFVAGQ